MTNAPAPTFVSTTEARRVADTMLDKRYVVVTSPQTAAIEVSRQRRTVDRRLVELGDEFERIRAAEKQLDADNPVIRAFEADFESWIDYVATVIDANAPAVQRSGIDAAAPIVKALSLPGIDERAIGWITPDGDQMEEAIDYTSQPAWKDKIRSFKDWANGTAGGYIATGLNNPVGMLDNLRSFVDTMPRSQADTLARTLQLNSERAAVAAIGVVNAPLIATQVRVADLAGNPCLACIVLHGTELSIGEYVVDHPNGRCQAVLIINGRTYQIRTGEEWLDSMTDEQRGQYMGYANAAAYAVGKVSLREFVSHHTDPLYGETLRQASLRGVLGEQAQQFYKNRQGEQS